MSKSAVVLESPTVLSELCGVNDENLRLLEELLDTRILYRGNELYLDSEDDEKREALVRIIDELKSHIKLGQSPSS